MMHTKVIFFAVMSLSVSLLGMHKDKYSSPGRKKPVPKLAGAHSSHNQRDEKHRAETAKQLPDLELRTRHSAHSNYGSPGSSPKLATLHGAVANEAECNQLLVDKIREAMSSECCRDPLAQRLADYKIEDHNLYNVLLRHFNIPETPAAKSDTTPPAATSSSVPAVSKSSLETVMRKLVQEAAEADALFHRKQVAESEKSLKEHKELTEKLFAEHKHTAENAAQEHKRTTKKERLISAGITIATALVTYLTTHYAS